MNNSLNIGQSGQFQQAQGRHPNRGSYVLGFGLPFVLFTSFWVSAVFPGKVFGYNVSGWLWVVVLISAVWIVTRRLTKVAFPVLLWIPWVAYLLLRVHEWSLEGLQSTVQILLPVIVATAASTSTYSLQLFDNIDRWLRVWLIGLCGIFIAIILPWLLSDIENSGWITGGVIALVFEAYFLCRYLVLGQLKRDLFSVLAAITIPALLTLRGPVMGAVALCVLVIAPLSLAKRLVVAALALLVLLSIFYSPRFQAKTFFSGQGNLPDLRKENPDINTNGRVDMQAIVEVGLSDSLWIGHGANSAGQSLLAAGMDTYAVHNDWLRIRHDYGRIGVIILSLSMTLQIILLCRLAGRATPEARVLIYSGASCFVPFIVVMFSDNILVYCQYFTAPHFLIIGYAYSAARMKMDDRAPENSRSHSGTINGRSLLRSKMVYGNLERRDSSRPFQTNKHNRDLAISGTDTKRRVT